MLCWYPNLLFLIHMFKKKIPSASTKKKQKFKPQSSWNETKRKNQKTQNIHSKQYKFERTNERIDIKRKHEKLWQKLGRCHEWYMATRKESDKGCKSVRWIEIATSYTWIGRQNKGKPRFKAILTIIAFDVHFECLSCIRWNNAFCAKVSCSLCLKKSHKYIYEFDFICPNGPNG